MKPIFITIFLFTILIGCDINNSVSPDESLPIVYVTYPANWSTISQDELTIIFEVVEANLDSVEIFVNGLKQVTLFTTPFELNISSSDYDAGQYTTYCKAYDKEGNIGISEIVNFYWNEQGDSEIRIDVIRPVFWELFEENQIQASLNIESTYDIEKVDIFVDGYLVHTFDQEPYDTSIEIGTTGEHNFYACATDSTGYSKNSDLVNFSIQLPDTENPSGFITYPANWSIHSGIMQVRISATDNETINKIELYIDGEQFTEIMEQPYNVNANTNLYENGYHTLYAIIYDSSDNYTLTQLVNFEINN